MDLINFLRITPRKGLLADSFEEGELEKLFSKIPDDYREKLKNDMMSFMESEYQLVEQGYKGKYAIFHEGKCWGILENQLDLLGSFDKNVGNVACFCDIIGGK